jgi:molecular chaperone GrpE
MGRWGLSMAISTTNLGEDGRDPSSVSWYGIGRFFLGGDMSDKDGSFGNGEWVTEEPDASDPAVEPSGDETTGEVVYPAEAEWGGTPAASVAVLEAELQETRNRLLRNAADYDNYRKRLHRDREDALRYANERVLRDLLPVLDNLERALDAPCQGASAEGLAEGVAMVLQHLRDVLLQYEVRPVNAAPGEVFNPAFHEALRRVETEEYEQGCIAEELQKGYMYHQRLLRPSRVVVAMAPESTEPVQALSGDDDDDFDDEDTLPEVPVFRDEAT